MSEESLRRRLRAAPPVFDGVVASSRREEFLAAADAAGCRDRAQFLIDSADVGPLLYSLFGTSPYLGQLLIDDPAYAATIADQPPERSLDDLLNGIAETAAATTDPLRLAAPFRHAKARLALLTAVCDVGGVWSLEQVTLALSLFAEKVLCLAVDCLLAEAAAKGDFDLPDPDHPSVGSGLAIIAMGKLGARELNYSSDIDLMVFFDQDVTRYTGSKTPRDAFVRMIQTLVRLLQDRTADGYVFRVDLRLRPDPASTPIVLSMSAAEHYYESFGQNWERAAMIKARTVAGDIAAGQAFLARIAPFIWRKHLDYAAIQDIHSIKRQIHSHRGHGQIAVAGHDVKVGRGGIREVEFFAQTLQLIAGGRDRRLRVAPTRAALAALRETDRIDAETETALYRAYVFLRQVEHRIQMVADEQTQTMPSTPVGVTRIARFMGYADTAAFEIDLRATLEEVQRRYGRLFERAPALDDGRGSLVFTGTQDDPDTIETLRRLGFEEPQAVAAAIRGWHHGRYRAMRSTRARELLTELTPKMLDAFARTASPQHAFNRFDEFLQRLPSGIQLFSLFQANAGLFDLIAEIMGTAPRLAEFLSLDPSRFDAMLLPAFFTADPGADALAAALDGDLSHARDFEDALDLARRFCNDQKLRIGVALLRGAKDGAGSGRAFADLADAVLRALLPVVERDVARLHGRIAGGAMAVLGMGRLGSREMTIESDLDLMFIYDAPDAESDGPKPLPASQYFGKLSQRLIAALTVMTGEGILFEVDMRLRPSGNKGPVAVGLAGFGKYQREEAWTWEHLALTRARVVAGPTALRSAIETTIRAVLSRPRDPAKLVTEVASMRRRMVAGRGGSDRWDVKNAPGGLIDIEFVTQYLELRHGHAAPAVLEPNIQTALERLGELGLLDPGTVADLREDQRLQADILALVRLCHSGTFDAGAISPGLARALARAGGMPDFSTLAATLAAAQDRARGHYDRLVEAPAAPYLNAGSDPS